MILVISLLIWRLLELVMRTELQARQATVPGWDNKPTDRPTAYMVTWRRKGVLLLCFGDHRQLAKPLTDTVVSRKRRVTRTLPSPKGSDGQSPELKVCAAMWVEAVRELYRINKRRLGKWDPEVPLEQQSATFERHTRP